MVILLVVLGLLKWVTSLLNAIQMIVPLREFAHIMGIVWKVWSGGPTFQARLGIRGEDVDDTDHVWDILAYYVAQASIQATTILRPEKIIFGGSVARPQLIKKVREQFERMFNHYMEVGEIEDYIIHPSVPRNESATRGNFALAAELLK